MRALIAVGDIMLDVFLLPELRASEQTAGLHIRGGGSAANTAAWGAYLGVDSGFVGCVGDDTPGRILRDEMDRSVSVSRIRTIPDVETGAVLVRLSDAGERVMRSSRGANAALSDTDLPTTLPISGGFVHITGYTLLGSGGLDLLIAVAQFAHNRDALLSFDPSSVSVVKAIGARVLRDALKAAHVDVLLPNAFEARALAGHNDTGRACAALTGVSRDVIVKCGQRGAVACTDGNVLRITTSPLHPVDSTGAGDAFNAGVLAGLMRGYRPEAACRAGNEAGAEAIRRVGGRPPLDAASRP